MKRIDSRAVGIDQGTTTLFSDFETGGEMWTGSGPRERRTQVRFSAPFRGPPSVHVALSMLDIEREQNQRMDLGAEAVTAEGFEVVFRTWGDTRIARARASWLAIGELPEEDDWTLE